MITCTLQQNSIVEKMKTNTFMKLYRVYYLKYMYHFIYRKVT